MDDRNISIITESTNNLWIQSKGNAVPLELNKHDLEEALAQVIPRERRSNPRENPLNLIIPAYDALWRVVLSGVLQVAFVKAASSPTWRSVLARLLAKDTLAVRIELVKGPVLSAVSVDLIVMEALRLCPTVKPVYRHFHMDNEAGPVNVAADIEACQRTEAHLGADAERFGPFRWINASMKPGNPTWLLGCTLSWFRQDTSSVQ